jgi:hypothetical protein
LSVEVSVAGIPMMATAAVFGESAVHVLDISLRQP